MKEPSLKTLGYSLHRVARNCIEVGSATARPQFSHTAAEDEAALKGILNDLTICLSVGQKLVEKQTDGGKLADPLLRLKEEIDLQGQYQEANYAKEKNTEQPKEPVTEYFDDFNLDQKDEDAVFKKILANAKSKGQQDQNLPPMNLMLELKSKL